jgi:NO-binding membrane sensor protein with MHYT domain
MHYVGMGALQVSPGIQYDPWLFPPSLSGEKPAAAMPV